MDKTSMHGFLSSMVEVTLVPVLVLYLMLVFYESDLYFSTKKHGQMALLRSEILNHSFFLQAVRYV